MAVLFELRIGIGLMPSPQGCWGHCNNLPEPVPNTYSGNLIGGRCYECFQALTLTVEHGILSPICSFTHYSVRPPWALEIICQLTSRHWESIAEYRNALCPPGVDILVGEAQRGQKKWVWAAVRSKEKDTKTCAQILAQPLTCSVTLDRLLPPWVSVSTFVKNSPARHHQEVSFQLGTAGRGSSPLLSFLPETQDWAASRGWVGPTYSTSTQPRRPAQHIPKLQTWKCMPHLFKSGPKVGATALCVSSSPRPSKLGP